MEIALSIDGRALTVEKGTSLLQAARQYGLYIPTLCDYPGLPASGSCRMCIVEIQGRANTPTACTTPAENGMIVQTHSLKVQALRRELLQLLLAEHPAGCLVCPENSACDECMVTVRKLGATTGCRTCPKDQQCGLQEMVEKLGIEQLDYPMRYRMLKVKKNDPFFDRDYNLCIQCGRCVRACEHLHFTSSLAYTKRGSELVVGTAFNHTHLQTDCNFCGTCLEVCPTGALTEKTRKWDGTPQAETISTCPLCSLGCQLRLLSKNEQVIGSLPAAQPGVEPLCVKGRFGITELVNHPTRLHHPQKTVGSHRMQIPWAEAIRMAAEKLAECPPGQFEMRISASASTEDLYVAQKFTDQVMHSQRFVVPAVARYGGGLAQVAALLARAQPPAVLAQAQTLLCLGFDGRYAQSVIDMKIRQAKTAGEVRLVTLHPHTHSLSRNADLWLRPQPGEEADCIAHLTAALINPPPAEPQDLYARAAHLLHGPGPRVVVVGAHFLTHPANQLLLPAAAALAEHLHAALVILPEEGNLAGALLLGATMLPPAAEPAVRYCIGETAPGEPLGQTFCIYQNLYPPNAADPADLLLPAAAFSETAGSLVDAGGLVQAFQPAVPPPGAAEPAWQTLGRIARQLGAPGFDFASSAEIQVELAARLGGYELHQRVSHRAPVGAAQAPSSTTAVPYPTAHTYLGFPLSQWVEGLTMLVADEEVNRV